MRRCTRTIVGCSTASSVSANCASADAVIAANVIARQRANSKVGAAHLRKPTRAIKTAFVAHAIMRRAKRDGVSAKMKK
jgi:hypothetical protein